MTDLDTLIRDADPAANADFQRIELERVINGGRPPRLRSREAVAVGIAVAVVVAVSAIALALGGERQHAGGGSAGVSARPDAASLIRILGILRRPQTAADRTAWVTVSGNSVVPRSERLAATAPWRTQMILFIQRARSVPPADRLKLLVATRSVTKQKARLQSAGGPGWTAQEVEAGQAVLQQPRPLTIGQPPRPGGQSRAALPVRLYMVVPDGVARVSFLTGADIGASSWVPAAVHNNVAFAQLSHYCCGPSVISRWYAADGKLIKVVGGPPGPRALAVLGPHGIGGVQFGSGRALVRAKISVLLGQAGGPYAPGASCGVDHGIKWWDQWTANGEPALTAYFRHGAFVGYQVGDLTSPRRQDAGWELSSTRGLRVGDTLARGRRLYGPSFVVSPAQGGSWSAHQAGGVIKGYAWAWQGPGVREGRVATIDAGDVGCPAASP